MGTWLHGDDAARSKFERAQLQQHAVGRRLYLLADLRLSVSRHAVQFMAATNGLQRGADTPWM